MLEELSDLIDGYRRFRSTYFSEQAELFPKLSSQGQSPEILVVACCDARVDPAIVLGCAPGDLFVIRNVANIVPPYEAAGNYHGTSAALEFAIHCLPIRHIIVLGHAQCGGIHSLVNAKDPAAEQHHSEFIGSWMQIVADACQMAPMLQSEGDAPARACEKAAITISLKNLMSFSWIRSRVEAKTLQLHGWYFDLVDGSLSAYEPENRQFRSIPD